MSDRFETHARTVTLLTLISRITGLLRDAALSRVFGAGTLMSAFFFAFMIPNLFRRLFGEGALAAAFLPAYTKAFQSDPELAKAIASLTVARLTVLLGLLTIVLELILLVLASTVSQDNPAIVFTMVMLPYMPMVCMVAILGAMLQVHGRFGPTAASPVILNVFIIAATVGLASWFVVTDESDTHLRYNHLLLLGGALLVAGAVQMAWAVLALRRHAWWTRDQKSARVEFRRMLRMMGPMVFSLGVLQLNTLMDGLIASYPVTFETQSIFGFAYPLDHGSMAILSFAQRLYQFPLGVFGIAVATAIFPLLSKQANNDGAFVETLRRGLRLVIFVGLPASAGLMLVAQPLTSVIYQGGEFSSASSARVGWVLLGYAPAIWAYSMTHTLTRAFYAKDDSKRPMRVAICIVALNFCLNCVLIWVLREAGLAWSTSICATIQVIALMILLRRHHVSQVIDRATIGSWAKSTCLTAAMCGVVLLCAMSMQGMDHGWAQQLLRLSVLTVAGMSVVGLGALIFRMSELKWALGLR